MYTLETAKIVSSFDLCLISCICNSYGGRLASEEEGINAFYGNGQKSGIQIQWALRIDLEACFALN